MKNKLVFETMEDRNEPDSVVKTLLRGLVFAALVMGILWIFGIHP